MCLHNITVVRSEPDGNTADAANANPFLKRVVITRPDKETLRKLCATTAMCYVPGETKVKPMSEKAKKLFAQLFGNKSSK